MKGVLAFIFSVFSVLGCAQEKKVLVFHKTEGFWHESIPTGHQVIEDLGESNSFQVKETNDANFFSEKELQEFQLVIFLNTTGNVLNEQQQIAFEKYLSAGGNFFGIHSAADTEYNWEFYGKLVGAYFTSHPEVQEAEVIVEKPDHPTVDHLPKKWRRTDEWYNYKDINPDINVLLSLDESSYEGGTNGQFHPIAWYRELEGGGVAIYTGGGHTIQSYSEPLFVEHLLKCILFALEQD